MRRAIAACVAIGAECVAATCRAELSDEVDALLVAWQRRGALAERATTVFMGQGERRQVGVKLRPTPSRPCVTVVAMAERGISLTLEHRRAQEAAGRGEADGPDLGDEGQDDAPRFVREGRGGIAVLERCSPAPDEAAAQALTDVTVTMSSPRGAIEVVAVAHAPGLAPIEALLPERATGTVAPHGEIGAPLTLAPIEERVLRATSTARRDGAAVVVPIAARASENGAGALVLKLTRGCHRLGVLADSAAVGDGAVDVDAELREPGTSEPLRSDRSHAPDGRIEVCLGATRKLELRWVGAGARALVTVLDGFWPPPVGVPERWSEDERSAMLWAMFKRQAPTVGEPPIAEWLGGAGGTEVPLALEPRACYLAAVGVTSGAVSALRLSLTSGAEIHYDDAVDPPKSALVSLCTGARATARAFVDVRATSANWRLALWRLGGTAP